MKNTNSKPPKTTNCRGFKGKAKKLAKRLNSLIYIHSHSDGYHDLRLRLDKNDDSYEIIYDNYRNVYNRLKSEKWVRKFERKFERTQQMINDRSI
jgi:hypothetical protein